MNLPIVKRPRWSALLLEHDRPGQNCLEVYKPTAAKRI